MLQTAPELRAKALLENLSGQTEGGIEENVLRGFRCRVRPWI